MQISVKKLSVHHSCEHATSFSVSELIIFMNSENDLDIFDEKMSEKMSFDAFLMSRFLLDSSQTSRNRRMINHVFSV